MMLKDINGVMHKNVADALCLYGACIGAQSAAHYDITDADPGERYHEAVRVLNEAGNIYRSLRSGQAAPGEEADAVAVAEQRTSRFDKNKALSVVRCLMQMADLHRQHRQYAAAKDAFEAVMGIYREVKVGICDELADAQAGYARLLLESANGQSAAEQNAVERGGDLLESRTLFEYALRMYRRIHGDLHPTVGRVLMGLGEVHIELVRIFTSLYTSICFSLQSSLFRLLPLHGFGVVASHTAFSRYLLFFCIERLSVPLCLCLCLCR